MQYQFKTLGLCPSQNTIKTTTREKSKMLKLTNGRGNDLIEKNKKYDAVNTIYTAVYYNTTK